MSARVMVFDTHPVQYKAPVYQALQRLEPGLFEVVYASDLSVKGYADKQFGVNVAWDTPLLEGYPYRVLHNEVPEKSPHPGRFTGRGVYALLRKERPAAVMLTQARYHFDQAAYWSARWLGIPILFRQETQDATYAQQRSALKSRLRHWAYRAYYAPARHAFAFGKLNQQHLLSHGVPPERISFARFSVPDDLLNMASSLKHQLALGKRAEWGVQADQKVLAFFGKFIDKKHPELLLQALAHLPEACRRRVHLVYVGAGELEPRLRALAEQALQTWGVRTTFTGFINQQALPAHYLAADVVVLPSRHQGEAWGLVVNEALNAGCAVAITEGVGCHVEFGGLARVRVTPVENAQALAASLAELCEPERDFDWAHVPMQQYSTQAAALALQKVFKACTP